MIRRVASWLASALMVGAFGCLVVACSSSGGSPVSRAPSPSSSALSGKVSPSALASALTAAGYKVTDVTPHEWAYGPSGTSLEAKVDGLDTYLNTFADPATLREWSTLVVQVGSYAATGDTWGIQPAGTITVDGDGTQDSGRVLAGRIATSLHATLVGRP